MDRRTFILAAAAAAVGLKANWAFSAELDDWLLEATTEDSNVRLPSSTGSITGEQHQLLFGLFLHIGKTWEMSKVSNIQERDFTDLVENKTTQTPSYLTEYIEATNIIKKIQSHGRTLDEAYARLLLPVNGADQMFKSRLGRAQTFVSSEFIIWYVSQGGFRRFGYKNYRGYMGGLFTTQPLPYRGV